MLSSTAEKIYWISRYTERAENTARLVNVNINLLLDIPHDRVSDFIHLVEITSDVEHFNETLLRKKIFYSSDPAAFKELVLEFVIYDTKNPGSIASCIEMAKYNPAGPPPKQAILIRKLHRYSPQKYHMNTLFQT